MEMRTKKFGIYSPVFGVNQNVPSVLLDKNSVPEISNARFYRNRIQMLPLRSAEFVEYVEDGTSQSITGVSDNNDIARFSVTAHGYEVGDYVAISNTTNYDSEYISISAVDTDWFETSLEYVADETGDVVAVTQEKVLTPDGKPVIEIANQFETDGSERVVIFTEDHIFLWVGATREYQDITPGQTTQTITGVTDNGGTAQFAVTAHGYNIGDVVNITGTTYYNTAHITITDVDTNWFETSLEYIDNDSGEVAEVIDLDATEYWSVTEYQGSLVFVNGNDGGLYYLSEGAVEELDTHYVSTGTPADNEITSAKYVWAFKNHLFLGNLTYTESAVSTTDQNLIVNSNIGEGLDTDGFLQDVDGNAGFYSVEGKGIISGAGISGDMFIVFKTDSSRRYWFAGGSIPFNSSTLYETLGTRAPGSIVNGRIQNSLYFYGSDNNFWEVTRGNIGRPVIVDENNLNPEELIKVRSKFVREYKEIYWSCPVGNTQETNNKVFIYTEDDQRWTFSDVPISAFGEYSQIENVTWDTWSYTSWDDIPTNVSWDSSSGGKDYIVDICGSESGEVFRTNGAMLDDGELYDSSFVISTDMTNKQGLPYKKRAKQLYLYYDNVGTNDQEILVEAKRNSENIWRAIAKFYLNDLATDNDIFRVRQPIDLFANNFLFRVTTQYNYSFIGMEFDYEVIGVR